MVVHIQEPDGAAKCGANVYNAWQGEGLPLKRTIMRNRTMFMHFVADPAQATCKRCMNKVERPETAQVTEDMTGKVFHYSFGYDMTINVFARVIRTTPKGLLCQEVHAIGWGDSYGPGGTGRVRAGNELKKDCKPFMIFKKTTRGYSYFTGRKHHWSLVEPDESFYENHCD